jgi:L-lactate dehydrogenase
MKHSKIAIIGAGSVGTTTAYALMLKNIAAEIIMVDIDETRCKGEILDLSDVLSFCGSSSVRTGSAQEAGQADIIIIAAGKKQKPGESRIDLIDTNKKIIASIMGTIKPISPHAVIIMVTNPVDILTLCAQEYSGLPRNQVFGSGTLLDTLRAKGLIARELNVAEQSVQLFILGEHGDTQVPAWSTAQIGGIPILDTFTQKDLDLIAEKTRKKAYEIISCKGATFFGIASCIATMCEAILFNQKLIVPVSCFIERYTICLSMPAVLGQNGIEKIINIPLNQQEANKLDESAHYLSSIKHRCKI